MASKPVPREIRKARSFLRTRGIVSKDIPPRRFAAAAKELDISFFELLQYIARMFMGGQGQQQERQENIRAAARGELEK